MPCTWCDVRPADGDGGPVPTPSDPDESYDLEFGDE